MAKKTSTYLSRVDSALEVQEEDRKRKLLTQRIEFARAGMAAFQAGQIKPALENYHSYLRLLEQSKGVDEGELLPVHFDLKKDSAELKMISVIFWDLSKLYDQAQSASKQGEFRHYLEKFVAFSKGMPFQSSNVDSIKKYLSGRKKPVHKEEFRTALQQLGGKECFVATALSDELQPETLPKLRRFRDQTLKPHHAGRVFIYWYYQIGPGLARRVEKLPRAFRVPLAKGLDLFAGWIVRKS